MFGVTGRFLLGSSNNGTFALPNPDIVLSNGGEKSAIGFYSNLVGFTEDGAYDYSFIGTSTTISPTTFKGHLIKGIFWTFGTLATPPHQPDKLFVLLNGNVPQSTINTVKVVSGGFDLLVPTIPNPLFSYYFDPLEGYTVWEWDVADVTDTIVTSHVTIPPATVYIT